MFAPYNVPMGLTRTGIKKFRSGQKFALGFVAAIAVSGSVFAHQGATGVVKERIQAMKSTKDSMAVIGTMIKGEREFDPGEAKGAADTIRVHAEAMPELFPDTEESRQEVSEAKPAVWQEKDRFDSLAQELEEQAITLASAIDSGNQDTVRQAFLATGKSCSSCHEDFRQKKN
jgi:cytochrome c556